MLQLETSTNATHDPECGGSLLKARLEGQKSTNVALVTGRTWMLYFAVNVWLRFFYKLV